MGKPMFIFFINLEIDLSKALQGIKHDKKTEYKLQVNIQNQFLQIGTHVAGEEKG